MCFYISIWLNIVTTFLSLCCQIVSSHRGVLQYLAARFYLQMLFKTYKLQCGASRDQDCLSSTPLLLRLRSEDFKPSQHLNLIVVLVRPFLSHFCCGAEPIMLLKEEAIRESGVHERVLMVRNNARVGGMCQNKMDCCLRQLAFSSSCIPVPCVPWASDAH